MNTRIGAPRADRPYLGAKDLFQGLFQGTLDRWDLGLASEPMPRRAVICKIEAEVQETGLALSRVGAFVARPTGSLAGTDVLRHVGT